MVIVGANEDIDKDKSNPKGIELEVMKVAELVYKIDELIHP
jgi:hypothetical protein